MQMKRTIPMTRTLLAVLLLLTSVHAWPQDDLLEPDKAFALAEPVISAGKITLKWKIAPGYYLYQNKFPFELKGSSSRLDKPLMPEAIRKQDEFFGEVKIYNPSMMKVGRHRKCLMLFFMVLWGRFWEVEPGTCYFMVSSSFCRIPYGYSGCGMVVCRFTGVY